MQIKDNYIILKDEDRCADAIRLHCAIHKYLEALDARDPNVAALAVGMHKSFIRLTLMPFYYN